MDSDAEFRFREELVAAEGKMYSMFTREEYNLTIKNVIVAHNAKPKTQNQYYLLRKYDVLKCGNVDKLIRKSDGESNPLYFVPVDEMFGILRDCHIATGHGGRDKMHKNLEQKYANITRTAVKIYKDLCVECVRKRKRPTAKGTVVKPIISKEFGSRAQIDLIDMQSMMNSTHRWILVFQDHLTKFCLLRPLTSKRAAEVAYQLLDIFLMLGAPEILQSDNGSEFTAAVITELKVMWPDLVIVHGKPRHPESQGSVERANSDIKDMLVAWMGDNNTNDWTVGLKFIQFQKNSSYHSGIKRSPYNALFGMNPKVGLSTSSLPAEIITRLQSEDDLVNAIQETRIEGPTEASTQHITTDDLISMEPRSNVTETQYEDALFEDALPNSNSTEPRSNVTETQYEDALFEDALPNSNSETEPATSPTNDVTVATDTPPNPDIANNTDGATVLRRVRAIKS